MKKYYFLSGLPRSGNTLLSSILNQNKRICVSPNSVVVDIVAHTDYIKNDIVYKNFPNSNCHDNFIKNIFNLYYDNWNCDYVIDRGPWGTPTNLRLLKTYLENEIKIICPLRNTLQILCSFIVKMVESEIINPHNSIEIEKECEDLMSKESIIGKYFWSCENLMRSENRSYAYFFQYEDFIKNPIKTIEQIYDYLNIDKYNHVFTNLSQYSIDNLSYDDNFLGFELHKIHSDLFLRSHDPQEILPQSVIKKYYDYNLTF